MLPGGRNSAVMAAGRGMNQPNGKPVLTAAVVRSSSTQLPRHSRAPLDRQTLLRRVQCGGVIFIPDGIHPWQSHVMRMGKSLGGGAAEAGSSSETVKYCHTRGLANTCGRRVPVRCRYSMSEHMERWRVRTRTAEASDAEVHTASGSDLLTPRATESTCLNQ